MTNISVIVPIYNVGAYLHQCLDSLVDQTYKDIEIILVDDGSTDDSGQICDEYASRDERITVFHKRNEGLSSARNTGVNVASSEYIMFVDSDDWVELNFCEKAYMELRHYNADLALFDFIKVYADGRSEKKRSNIYSGIISESEALRFNLQFAPAVWLGLYRRSLFNNIKFPVGKYHEDTGTTYKLIHEANKIIHIDEMLYNYRANRPGSIMSSKATRQHHDLVEMKIIRITDLWKWGYRELAQEYAFQMLIHYGCNDEQKPLIDIMNNMRGSFPKNISLKRRILMKTFWRSTVLFDVVCKVMRKRDRRLYL